MSKITPENIIAKLDRYAELVQINARFDLYAASGTPHDFGESICAEFEMKALEAELLDAGMFKATPGDVVSWARRKV